MMISVVIPCYNSSQTIDRAVRSVVNQTVQDIEIIVVDDCSQDWELTKMQLDSYRDARIIFIKHEKNKNGSAARNTGILNAQGKYIAFLDADDEWLPNHIKNALHKWNENNSTDKVIYCQNLIKTDAFKDIVMPLIPKKSDETISDYLFCNTGYISTPSLFSYAETFKNNLFNEQLIRHQDYDLLLRLEKNGYKFEFVSEVGVIVHWEHNNTDKKGGTWQFSYNWAIENKTSFSRRAFKCFVLKNCVIKLFMNGERLVGLKLFFKNCIQIYSLKELYKLISIFLFKKVIFAKI